MSLTPVLADEAVTDDLNLRSHSDGGRGVLKPRALNVESPAFKAAGTVRHSNAQQCYQHQFC